MKLFKYEGYEVKVAPEALTLKPFKKLWDRDKSKDKERATNEIAFLYFFCDVRSDYQYIVDDGLRMDAVKKGIGFPEEWEPDSLLKAAITFYNTFDTHEMLLLKMAAKGVATVQKTLEELAPEDTKSLKEYLSIMKLIPEVAAMIKEAEKAINTEEEYGEAKGVVEKAMFDDGLDEVADYVRSSKNNS